MGAIGGFAGKLTVANEPKQESEASCSTNEDAEGEKEAGGGLLEWGPTERRERGEHEWEIRVF